MMRRVFVLAVSAAGAAIVGCSSGHYPASPVPAPFSDLQAYRMADVSLVDRHGMEATLPKFAQKTGDGYLVGYVGNEMAGAGGTPPKPSHLVFVGFDGKTREVNFHDE